MRRRGNNIFLLVGFLVLMLLPVLGWADIPPVEPTEPSGDCSVVGYASVGGTAFVVFSLALLTSRRKR